MSEAVQASILIGFFDWARFVAISRSRDNRQTFELLDQFYKRSEATLHSAGGKIIKFMGDAGLAIFPEESADTGVSALLQLKREIDQWMHDQGIDSFLHVNCHFGEATIGPMGGSDTSRLDVIGEDVNLCCSLEHKGFTLTPQAFRKLKPETRKRFRKLTPPIVYRLA